jgi:hypothetical protein
MKKRPIYGINGDHRADLMVDDPVGTVVEVVGKGANDVLNTIRAWQGKDAPSTVGFEVQKVVLKKVKGALGKNAPEAQPGKPVLGSFTAAENERSTTRGPRHRA